MKIDLHPQLNKNLAITLPALRPLAALFVFLFVAYFPTYAVPHQQATTLRTFTDWCLNQDSLSEETLRTINAILQETKTNDCLQASKILSTLIQVNFSSSHISDLRPLSTLTHLTYLNFEKNQITDLKPLSSLINLTYLSLIGLTQLSHAIACQN